MSSLAIKALGVSKSYRIAARRESYRTLRDALSAAAAAPWRHFTAARHAPRGPCFEALREVSFAVEPGEVVGIVGRNGAGKSTLLKILARITEPTAGAVEIYGRVGSLLEVGTGFHQELTGRENIYLNGAILGMKRREIERKFDEIVAFAEVDQFIDTQVKHYSSGMYLRLAFAVAAHLDPEILLVDEVLAVGDMAFQRKCLGKMEDIARRGRTVLFVSHNLAAVEHLCRRGIVLCGGAAIFDGDIQKAVQVYVREESGGARRARSHQIDLRAASGREPGFSPLLTKLELFSAGRPASDGVKIGDPLSARVSFHLERPTAAFDVGLGFDDLSGRRIFTAHSLFQPEWRNGRRAGAQTALCEIPSFTLVPGEYKITVTLNIGERIADAVEDAARLTVAASDYYGTGRAPWNGAFVLPHGWRLIEAAPERGGGDLGAPLREASAR